LYLSVVEWKDGQNEELMANIIADNLFAQVYSEGNQFVLLADIIDHRKIEEAVSGDNSYVTMDSGMKQHCCTTKGWELCVQWKENSNNWITLKDLKNGDPIQVAEYAIANKIHNKPAFAWWVNYTMKKRQWFVSKIKTKHQQKTHKYGV
jgi:hypothetical protein